VIIDCSLIATGRRKLYFFSFNNAVEELGKLRSAALRTEEAADFQQCAAG
jgi:hypothetical protein